MKKVLLFVVAVMLVSSIASAEMKFRAAGSPQFGAISKFDDPIGTDVRKQNFVLDLDTSLEFYKGLGFGANFMFMPGTFDTVIGVSGDLNVTGLAFGPRYYYSLSDNWEVFGYANFGWYRSEVEASAWGITVSNTENNWGLNGGVGINYSYKMLTVGLKGGTHYIHNVGADEDMMVWTVGPTIGIKF